MQTEKEIRIARLTELLNTEPFLGSKAEFGRAIGMKSGAIVYQWITGRRPITEKTARALEKRFTKPNGWMDSLASGMAMQVSGAEENLLRIFRGFNVEQQAEVLLMMRHMDEKQRAATPPKRNHHIEKLVADAISHHEHMEEVRKRTR